MIGTREGRLAHHSPLNAPPQQRKAVVERLYRALASGETITRTQLAADARLSGKAVSAVLDDLRARSIISPGEGEPGQRGPKTRSVLRAGAGRTLVFGFGHHRLTIVLTDIAGEQLESTSLSPDSDVEENAADTLALAVKTANEMLVATGTRVSDLVGIGVSLPAPLSADARLYKGFMDAWQPFNIPEELRRRLALPDRGASPFPVIVENDANLAALRELRRGAARQKNGKSIYGCVIKWGSGLGAGIILDSEIYAGPNGLAGEIGHIATQGHKAAEPLLLGRADDTLTCSRCHRQCVEAVINSDGILASLRGQGHEFATIKEAIEAAHDDKGGPVHRIFADAATLLGHKLGPIISAFNLQLVVLDAFGDSRAYDLVVDHLRRGLEARMASPAFEQVDLAPATEESASPVLGAAERVLELHLAGWVQRLGGAGNGGTTAIEDDLGGASLAAP